MKDRYVIFGVLITLFLHISSSGQDYVQTVDWSFDGQYYAVARGRDVHIYEFESEQLISHSSLEDNIDTIDWIPLDHSLAVALLNGDLVIFEVDTKEQSIIDPVPDDNFPNISHVAWSSTNTVAVSYYNDVSWIDVIDADDYSYIGHVDLPAFKPVHTLKWSPDGTLIGLGYSDGELQIRDATTFETIQIIPAEPSLWMSFAWRPDGSIILYESVDGLSTAIPNILTPVQTPSPIPGTDLP